MPTGNVLALLLALLVAFSAVTCSASPKQQRDDKEPAERQIRPKKEKDRREFQDALQALKRGEYAKAKESFRLIQAEENSEAVSQLAELYVARAELGSLETLEKRAGKGGVERAIRMFGSLERGTDVDKRIRRAATSYRAYALLKAGEEGRAYAGIADYPDSLLGSAVLENERFALWPVLIEGLDRAGRFDETVEAAGRLYGEIEGAREEEPTSDQMGRLDDLAEFARSLGFQAASELGGEKREKKLDHDSGFVRAVAGWAHLAWKLDTDELAEKERAKIDELFQEVAADLNAVGAASRVGELSIKLATLGGSKRLVIGALLPLSGDNEGIGQRVLSGMLLAVRAFQHKGAPRVTLVFEDSSGEPSETLDRLDKLGAAAVVGPLDQSRAEAFAPIAEKLALPLVTMTAKDVREAAAGTSTEKGADSGVDEPPKKMGADAEKASDDAGAKAPVVFRNFMDPVTEARAVANLAFHEFGDRRAAVLYPDVGYGSRLMEAFAKEFRSFGGQVVATVSYDRTKSDFAATARKIARADPEAIFIPDSASKVAELSAFLADQDVWGVGAGESKSDGERTFVHYLGTSLWHDPIIVRQAATYVEGAVLPAWYAKTFADGPTRRFGRRFEAVFDRKPGNIEAFAYDNVRWIRRLMLERGIRTSEAVREALVGKAPYEGATGRASFSDEGKLQRTIRFVSVKKEKFAPFDLEVNISPGSAEQPSDQ